MPAGREHGRVIVRQRRCVTEDSIPYGGLRPIPVNRRERQVGSSKLIRITIQFKTCSGRSGTEA